MPEKFLPVKLPGTEKSLPEQTLDAVKLYHNIIHTSPVSIAYITGKKMVVTMVNDACLQLWGSDKSIIGKSLYDTLPDLMAQAGDILQDIYDKGSSFTGTEVPYIVNRNGKKVTGYFDFVWQAKFDDAGKVEGITAYATEVTERALATQKVKESQRELQSLANIMPQAVWMAHPDGRVFYFNDRIDMYKGASQGPDGIWNWQDIIHPDELEQTAMVWAAAISNGTVYEKEHRLWMKDGNYQWHLTRAIPQKDDTGTVVAWFGTTTNIQEQKVFAEKLKGEVEARTAELLKTSTELAYQKSLDEIKNNFISIASHELKTPLTVAKGYLELAAAILQDKQDQSLGSIVQKANIALSKLSNIVSDFLDINKMQHGKLILNYSHFNFNDVVEEAADHIKTIFPRRTLIIQQPGNTIMVEGDGERLRQVCANLLNNAIKYSAEDTAVELTAMLQNGHVLVQVKDNGIGIAAEDVPHIFNRYYRVEDVIRTHQGMGIGLYLSAEIINSHNGKIWVESEKGSGSTFCFTIPRRL